MYKAVDNRFFDIVGFSQESIMIWGFRSYNEEHSCWYVSIADAKDFLKAINEDPTLAEI